MKIITTKKAGSCAETGQSFKKGETVLYDPNTRKHYTVESNQAKQFVSNPVNLQGLNYHETFTWANV